MKTKINYKILRDISTDISAGRPLWGMLRANEYLTADSPLHRALRIKAQAKIQECDAKVLELAAPILAGQKLGELNQTTQAKVLSFPEASRPSTRKWALVPARKISFQDRREQLIALKAA